MNRAARFVSVCASFASLVALSALGACTTETQDNFTNPPPGPPATCTPVPALEGCTAGSVSYSCSSDRPDHGDTNLVCDDGTPGIGGGDSGTSGTTLYCCAPYGQWATECTPASVAGCGAQSIGFSCAGETSPDQADTSLVCSLALKGDGGASEYCCVSFPQSSGVCRCSSFDDDAGTCGVAPTGCSGAAIGFTCAAGHTPDELNPLLACDGNGPDGGTGGGYCCETP
jgi:hypothetical protein